MRSDNRVEQYRESLFTGIYRRLTVVLMFLIVLFASSACSKAKQGPPKTVPVVAGKAEQKDIPLQLKAIGNGEAYNAVSIKSQVNGELAEVYFKEGQDVKKGDRLFKIDPRSFESALKQAESALARDRAQAKNAGEDARRYASLVEKNFVSRQEYDRARTNADALEAVVTADEAAVENARLQLEYTEIRSPINGRTGAIAAQKGNVVKANDAPLVTINQVAPIYIAFSVPEQELANIRKYKGTGELRVEAIVPQGAGKPAVGALSFIDNKVNTSTGTILLKATFPNDDHSLWPGQFVDVILTLTTERNRVVIPSQAVQTGQQGPYVYVIRDDSTVDLRIVTPGRTYQNWTVIEKGVAAGEKVVTDGQLRLVPGAKVEIKNAPSQEGASTKSQMTNFK